MSKDILYVPRIEREDYAAIQALMGAGLPHQWDEWLSIVAGWPAQHSMFDLRPVSVRPETFRLFAEQRIGPMDLNALLDFAKEKAPAA